MARYVIVTLGYTIKDTRNCIARVENPIFSHDVRNCVGTVSTYVCRSNSGVLRNVLTEKMNKRHDHSEDQGPDGKTLWKRIWHEIGRRKCNNALDVEQGQTNR